ncbi:hypothetical protein [Spirosoma utsteinense]|uniref:Uncharacterized protein n=1 Tax=Spirosoma utsteinense TaxID=2585773 RepID=A0ABR6WET1_9BACT|nr:hypothetical protein [Spirosoma utsteinense]MBC3787159.1 hypothetical protein [Spirosoma utsteinense]MBC3795048.1 hypothetical protein [Spirosoma utsteinense]
MEMSITYDLLISLGFLKDTKRVERNRYKGVIGSLHQLSSLFPFEGFARAIVTVADLKYLVMLIDYNDQASEGPYPSHEN